MEHLIRKQALWRRLPIFSIISAILSVPVIAALALFEWYIAVLFASLVAAHGFYGMAAYLWLYDITARDLAVLGAYQSGITDKTEISEATEYTPAAVSTSLAALKKQNLI